MVKVMVSREIDIPAGYKFVSYGKPKTGDKFLDSRNRVCTALFDRTSNEYPIIEKDEIAVPDGWKFVDVRKPEIGEFFAIGDFVDYCRLDGCPGKLTIVEPELKPSVASYWKAVEYRTAKPGEFYVTENGDVAVAGGSSIWGDRCVIVEFKYDLPAGMKLTGHRHLLENDSYVYGWGAIGRATKNDSERNCHYPVCELVSQYADWQFVEHRRPSTGQFYIGTDGDIVECRYQTERRLVVKPKNLPTGWEVKQFDVPTEGDHVFSDGVIRDGAAFSSDKKRLIVEFVGTPSVPDGYEYVTTRRIKSGDTYTGCGDGIAEGAVNYCSYNSSCGVYHIIRKKTAPVPRGFTYVDRRKVEPGEFYISETSQPGEVLKRDGWPLNVIRTVVKPTHVPDGWKAIDYRIPSAGEFYYRYFVYEATDRLDEPHLIVKFVGTPEVPAGFRYVRTGQPKANEYKTGCGDGVADGNVLHPDTITGGVYHIIEPIVPKGYKFVNYRQPVEGDKFLACGTGSVLSYDRYLSYGRPDKRRVIVEKATPEWDYPTWLAYDYVARDGDGAVYAYSERPTFDSETNYWRVAIGSKVGEIDQSIYTLNLPECKAEYALWSRNGN